MLTTPQTELSRFEAMPIDALEAEARHRVETVDANAKEAAEALSWLKQRIPEGITWAVYVKEAVGISQQ